MTSDLARMVMVVRSRGWTLTRIAKALNHATGRTFDELDVIDMLHQVQQDRERTPWWWVENRVG